MYVFTIDDSNGFNSCKVYQAGSGSGYLDADGTTDVTDGEWHYLTCLVSGTNLYVYVDGILENSDTTPTGSRDTASIGDAYIGMFDYPSGYSWFNGLIDDVRAYNYARTQAQIAWDYNRGKPQGWWKLDECSGTTAYDSGSAENNGTITIGSSGANDEPGACSSGDGTHAWNNGTNGQRNASLDFDGTDDYVDMGNVSELDFGDSQDFTIAAWINRGTYATDDTIVAKRISYASGDEGYALRIRDSDDLQFEVSDGTNEFELIGTSKITSAGWYHVVVVFDEDNETNTTVYLNSIEDKKVTYGTIGNVTTLTNTDSFRVGSESGGALTRPFDGQIDEVKVLNYALTAEQVRNDYNSGAVNFGY
jgi:hypothetical protein